MQSVMAVKDPQAFMSMAQDGKMEGITNKLTAHQQAVSEVIREATDEFAKLAEVSVEQMKSSMKEWLDSISANAPAGSEAFVNAMKTSLDTTLQGVDQMQATLKEVATNLEKTTEQAVETIKGQVATVKKTAAKTTRATRR
jgi:methyl-accepting chemotaxis protein